MSDRKPTRTDSNKSPRSGAIRKGSMSKEQIKQEALKLTGSEKFVEDLMEVKKVIEEVQAPAIEPVAQGNYEVYAGYIQAHIDEHETYTESVETLKKLFPQCKQTRNIAQNLKRTYGINYRHSDLGEYVFFDGETKDEIIERMDKEMEELILEKNKIVTENYLIKREKHELQSDLYNTQYQRNRLFFLVILLIIIITLTNYYG